MIAIGGDDSASATATWVSILTLYRRLIANCRALPALSLGSYAGVTSTEHVLVYERAFGGQRMLIAMNLSHLPQTLQR